MADETITHPSWEQIEPGALVPGQASPHQPGQANLYRPGEREIELSKAISLKRIADALDSSSPRGSMLYYLEQIASAANAGRS